MKLICLIFAVLVMLAGVIVFMTRRDAEQDARRQDMMPSMNKRQYLFTSDQFIDRCGNPKAIIGDTLDYGDIQVSFRPAFDGIAAHFYRKTFSAEIDGVEALKQLRCTL
jgi:hypothetical protein